MLRHHEDRRSLALSLVLFPLVPALSILRPTLLPWLLPLLVYASFTSGVLTHYHVHKPIFVARTLNDAYSLWLSAFYGLPVMAWVPTHNQNHHQFLDGPGDAARTSDTEDSLLGALSYPSRSSAAQMRLLRDFVRGLHGRRLGLWNGQIAAVVGLQLLWLGWSVTRHGLILGLTLYLAVGLAPALLGPWAMMFTNYVQHVDCDPNSPDDHSRNFVGRLQNWLVFNAGYHTVHHEQPGQHWSRYPELHRARAARIAPHLNQRTILQFCLDRYVWRRGAAEPGLGTS